MGPKCWRTYRSSANKTSSDWLSSSSLVQWAKFAARGVEVGWGGAVKGRVGGWGDEPFYGFACQLRLLWMARRWRAPGCACHLLGPVGSVEIAEVPFTSNRKTTVNIHLFNNPACAHGGFWRLWGLHFPLMYLHCQTLYLKSSKMELVTFSLFSFIQSNLKGFLQYFSCPRCFVV